MCIRDSAHPAPQICTLQEDLLRRRKETTHCLDDDNKLYNVLRCTDYHHGQPLPADDTLRQGLHPNSKGIAHAHVPWRIHTQFH